MSEPTDKEYWGKFYSGTKLNYPNSRVELLTSILCTDIEEAFLIPGGKKKILEVGCGGALFSGLMAARGYQVACCDFSPEAVEIARQNLSGIKPPVEVFVGDVLDLPVAPGSFDLVYCGGLLDIFDDPAPAFRGICKVLRPGGVLVASLPSRNFSIQTLGDIFNGAVHGVKSAFGRPSENWRRYRENISHAPAKPPSFYAEAAIAGGLSVLTVQKGYPLPELSLPGLLKRAYVRAIRGAAGLLKGKVFSNNLFFRLFGIYYYLAARKPGL